MRPWIGGLCGALGGGIGAMLGRGDPLDALLGAVGGFLGVFYAMRKSSRQRPPTEGRP